MLYFLLTAGLILILYGGFLLKKGNPIPQESFRDLLAEQSSSQEDYNHLAAGNQDLKSRLTSVEDKLDQITNQLEQMYQCQSADLDCEVISEQTDSTASLNTERGEVRFIQNLLKKEGNS